MVTKAKRGNRVFYQIASDLTPITTSTFANAETLSWVKLLNRPSTYAFNYIVSKSNRDRLPGIYGVSVPSFWFNGTTFAVYYIKSELELLGKTISHKLENDPGFAVDDIESCKQACIKLITTVKKLSKENFSSQDKKALAKNFSEFTEAYEAVFPYITTPHAIERYFETKIKGHIPNEKDQQILLSPISLFDEERDSALKVAEYLKKHGKNKQFEKLLTIHWQNFLWLPMWTMESEPLQIDYFRQEIDDILKTFKDPGQERNRVSKEDENNKTRVNQILKVNKASPIVWEHLTAGPSGA